MFDIVDPIMISAVSDIHSEITLFSEKHAIGEENKVINEKNVSSLCTTLQFALLHILNIEKSTDPMKVILGDRLSKEKFENEFRRLSFFAPDQFDADDERVINFIIDIRH